MMMNLLFGFLSAVLGLILVEASLSAVGAEQFLELMGAVIAFGLAVLCLSLATCAAAMAWRWRRRRAEWRQEARRAAYR